MSEEALAQRRLSDRLKEQRSLEDHDILIEVRTKLDVLIGQQSLSEGRLTRLEAEVALLKEQRAVAQGALGMGQWVSRALYVVGGAAVAKFLPQQWTGS
jgi:hypothetical protein